MLFKRLKNNLLYDEKQPNCKKIYVSQIGIINGHLEHVHSLISLSSGQSIDKTIMLLKRESSDWIN